MAIDYNDWRKAQKNSHSHHPSVRLRNHFILNQLKHINFETFMDAWCGDWYLLNLVHTFYPDKHYSWLDISDEICSRDIGTSIDFSLMDLWKPSTTLHKTYDVVVCSEVIEHIEDWKQVVHNLANLPKKWWYLILTTQSWKRYKSDMNIWHLKHFTLDELEKEFDTYWFEIVSSYKKWFPFYNLQKWLYQKIEKKAQKVQQSKETFFSRILFDVTYFLFLVSLTSRTLWPQIFMVLQKK